MPPSSVRNCPGRTQSAFLTAGQCPGAKRLPKAVRQVRVIAAAGAHPDPVGAASTANTEAGPALASQPPAIHATAAPISRIVPHVSALLYHLGNHASSFGHHLALAAHAVAAAIPRSKGFPQHPAQILDLVVGLRPLEEVSASTAASVQPDDGRNSAALHNQRWEEAQQQQLEHWDDEHLWSGPHPAYLPWGCGEAFSFGHPTPASDSSPSPPFSTAAEALPPSSAAPFSAALSLLSGSTAPTFPPRIQLSLPAVPNLSDVPSTLSAQLAGLMPLLHSAHSMQQRATVTVLWQVSRTLHAADRYRRSLPSAYDMPSAVRWTAASAAVHAEESMAATLGRVAAAAAAAATAATTAAAAVGLPLKLAAAAAADDVTTVPHLTLVRHARRRLLAAAVPLLQDLRHLQRGCTTHVLLHFLLFSSVQPGLRRQLIVRLEVLARRAVQLAFLQAQYDKWLVANSGTATALAWRPSQQQQAQVRLAGAKDAVDRSGNRASAAAASSSSLPAPESAAAAAAGFAPAAATSRAYDTDPLSARWYRNVFAPEMLACRRQLRRGEASLRQEEEQAVAAMGSATASATAGQAAVASDPPGRFDLRDLYRLIRVIEVAVEDLERCK